MRTQLHIGEVAQLLGVTPRTIRHYQKVGLLAEPERTGAGYRLYARKTSSASNALAHLSTGARATGGAALFH